mmetsp:Transcript_153874/g.295051  ORF Transcript_153874/g.295051 Transcript_153874/m.295051 type:complete len:257 (-) Transcript_153874:645-1415(-)
MLLQCHVRLTNVRLWGQVVGLQDLSDLGRTSLNLLHESTLFCQEAPAELLKKAPKLLLALGNELADSTAVLIHTLTNASELFGTHPGARQQLCGFLRQLSGSLTQIKHIMLAMVAMQGTFCADAFRLARQAEELQRLFRVNGAAQELSDERHRLCVSWLGTRFLRLSHQRGICKVVRTPSIAVTVGHVAAGQAAMVISGTQMWSQVVPCHLASPVDGGCACTTEKLITLLADKICRPLLALATESHGPRRLQQRQR